MSANFCFIDKVYGHKMPEDFEMIQERSQLRAYNKKAAEPYERGHEVFVLNLPRDILMQYVYKFMVECGEIYDIRFLMDFSGFNRGMCYVKYITKLAARKAALVLDRCEITLGNPVSVKMSFDNSSLLVQNIPKHIPFNNIRSILNSVIGDGLLQINEVDHIYNDNKKSCVLMYDSHRKALEARKKVWPGLELWSTNVPIDWAAPPELKESRILFFKNVPSHLDRAMLFEVLKTIIDIHTVLKIHLVEGTGYIVFTGESPRSAAFKRLNDCFIFGRKIKVSYKSGKDRNPSFYSKQTEANGKNMALKNDTGTPLTSKKDSSGNENIVEELTNTLDNNTLIHFYRSCPRKLLEKLPVIYPAPVTIQPGLYNELGAVQEIVHNLIDKHFPHTTWTCLDPDDEEIPSHSGALRIRPTVNNEIYDFVLLCVSNELASGSSEVNNQ